MGLDAAFLELNVPWYSPAQRKQSRANCRFVHGRIGIARSTPVKGGQYVRCQIHAVCEQDRGENLIHPKPSLGRECLGKGDEILNCGHSEP